VIEDYRTAPISPAERELFAFIDKMNLHCAQVEAQDLEKLRNAGWTDEAIYDAITVCSLFNFYNRWIDASGVHDMSPGDYKASGKRLAERGYLNPQEGER
jgi:alkylhydroperoxidase family enzyme